MINALRTTFLGFLVFNYSDMVENKVIHDLTFYFKGLQIPIPGLVSLIQYIFSQKKWEDFRISLKDIYLSDISTSIGEIYILQSSKYMWIYPCIISDQNRDHLKKFIEKNIKDYTVAVITTHTEVLGD